MSDRINVIFDSQILNDVQACGEKLNLGKNLDLIPIRAHSPFEEGDLLHRMFEFYNLVNKQYKTEILYDNVKYQQLLQAVLGYGQFVSPSLELNPTECSEVLFQWEKYALFTRMDGVEILEVERPYVKELFKDEQLGVYYAGKIDRFTNTPSFGLCPRDYKKAAQRKTPNHLGNQFLGYCLATGSDIILVDQVGFQKTLPPENRFISYPLYYNVFQKDEWLKDTIWWARQYAFYIETGTWPRNRTSCDKYSGCDYREICDAPDVEMRNHIIKTKFTVGDHWDPTSVLDRAKKNEEREIMARFAGDVGIDLEVE